MISTRVNTKLCSPKQVAQLSRVVAPIYHSTSILSYPVGIRLSNAATAPRQSQHASTPRSFSTTSAARLRDFFPAKETTYIRQTPPAWPHEGYTEEQMLSVVPDHREPRTLGDKIAWKLVRLCRYVSNSSSVGVANYLTISIVGEWTFAPGSNLGNRSIRSALPLT